MRVLPRLRIFGLSALACLCAVTANAKEALDTLRAKAEKSQRCRFQDRA